MKATNLANTKKTILGIVLLSVLSLNSFGQGALIEGASKLFAQIRENKTEEPELIMHVNYIPDQKITKDSFNMNKLFSFINKNTRMAIDAGMKPEDFAPAVVKSFTIDRVDISFEKEIETESWMTEPFNDEMEASLELEEWMTESFSSNNEGLLTAEEWMSEPFSNNFEESLQTEEWMLKPISNSTEQNIQVEDWMLENFSESVEEEIELENWMTQLLLVK